MKKVVLLLLIFMSFKGYSQMKVGINPKSIDSSAMFQVDVNQTAGKAKGLLLPRVPLNSTTDVATILGPATGLVVYAKGGSLAEGLYVWDGAKWQKMSDANLDLDKDSTNEIQKLTFSNNVVKLSKGGDSVNLASLIVDTTSLSNRINTNKQAIIDTATSLRTYINTHITADKDIDSTNEIQKLTFSNNIVKLSKGGDSVNLASLIIDTTSLSNRINTNKQAIIDTATSLRTYVNTHITADLDIDSTNEIQKLTFSNNVVKLSKGGDSVNLASLIIDTTSLSNRINTNKQAIIDTATSLRTYVNTHITADKDIDSTNEIQKLTFSNNVVKLSKGGDSVNLASLIIDTTSLSNRINTNKQSIIDTATSLRTYVNTHITADKDIDSTNEIQKLTFSNNVVKLSKGGDSVNLASLIIDTTSLSNRINTNKQAIIDTATSLRTYVNTHITADKDIDSTNEIQKLSMSGDSIIRLSKGGDSVSIKGYKNLAKNGTSISGDSVVLGGTLDRATTITTSSTNTLAISGLSKATTSDSVLMSSGATGIVKKISVPELRKLNIAITAATSYTVSDTLDAVIFNGTANTTFTIPAASTCKGKEIRFMNYAKSASNISITLSAPVVYEGDVSNITHTVINSKMTVYEYPEGLGSQYGNTITIISDGTDWYKVGM
jgi:hypothetical protein